MFLPGDLVEVSAPDMEPFLAYVLHPADERVSEDWQQLEMEDPSVFLVLMDKEQNNNEEVAGVYFDHLRLVRRTQRILLNQTP